MIRLLGRQTSGNVQKVIFCLEEIRLPYVREDYGRQFGNTSTDEYRKLNPNAKVPTLIDGDLVIWESHTILRYLAAVHAPALTGATPGERTLVERWMDWLLASLNTPYVAVFKDAKKPAPERAPDFPAQVADLVAQLGILNAHLAGRRWFALDRLTLADIALASIVKRCLEFPIERPAFAELKRWQTETGFASGVCGGNRSKAEHAAASGSGWRLVNAIAVSRSPSFVGWANAPAGDVELMRDGARVCLPYSSLLRTCLAVECRQERKRLPARQRGSIAGKLGKLHLPHEHRQRGQPHEAHEGGSREHLLRVYATPLHDRLPLLAGKPAP